MLASRKVLGDNVGRYQLLVQIGQGGMAEVFLGRLRGAAGFAKLVVLKRMHSHLSHDKRFIELFINEGRMVAKLAHSNICQVHELGEEEGSLFLVMEYLSGVPWEELARGLPRGTADEIPLIAGVLGQACDGLHHAHQLRDHLGSPTPVVHRDVSPQNLFITTDGTCKVLDFGVAKMSTADRYSHTGVVLGKLPYMAPEQICGQPVDARTDVFAMGVVLWEALTGKRLFSRPSDYLIWKAINEDPIPSVLELRPDLPPEIDAIVRRALQRTPSDRFPSIQAFAHELRQAAQPAPFDNHAIAEALRQLCALQLAETKLVVATALADIDRPAGERAAEKATDDELGRAPTVYSGSTPDVRLREESFAPMAKRTTWPKAARWWPYVVIPLAAAAAAVVVAIATHDGAPARAPAVAQLSEDVGAGAAAAPELPAAVDAGAMGAGEALDAAMHVDAATGAISEPDAATPPVRKGESDEQRLRKRPPARPVRGPSPRTERGRVENPERIAAAPAKPGLYSVDSRPYATISIDGVVLGETPLYRVPLAPGSHQVRAVRQDGATKTFSITIAAGKEVSSGRLKW